MKNLINFNSCGQYFNVNVNLKPPFLILSILLEVKTESTVKLTHNEVRQGQARSFGHGSGQNGQGVSKKNHKSLPICDITYSKCGKTEPTETIRYLR